MVVRGLFHDAVAEWFQATYPAPTRVQSRAWPLLRARRDLLAIAPTGSGKTLCAFLAALSELCQEAQTGELPQETRVLYVTPLKALSRDVERNLRAPLDGIQARLEALSPGATRIQAAVRSGDTDPKLRSQMAKQPPHVLVTTPESLYLLLTSQSGRQLLGTTRTVILDEIHALLPNKRGAHLSLSLERLDALCQERSGEKPQRIGLSATQRPLEEVRDFLCGSDDARRTTCAIVDEGHQRNLDLALWVPGSPLEAIMSAEGYTEVYDELAAQVRAHKTTLIFTNTRKLAERVTRFLGERLGNEQITSHHGSLSRELRESAERRLAEGSLKALVATASLELGIDVGDVELVCQLGSPGRISTLLQRVGRAGHQVGGTSKGILFPTTRDQLVECVALLAAVRRGELDAIQMAHAPLDILAQQIVATLAGGDWLEQDLTALVHGASPYRDLDPGQLRAVISMLEQGFVLTRGRRGAYVHRDETTGRLHARRGALLAAILNGGAIPDTFDYEVLLLPEEVRIGTVHEDFAIESSAGDVFQLGNASYQIEKVDPGVVRVRDARGMLPNLPFWIGEAPARSTELSLAVSRLRSEVDAADERASSALVEEGLSAAAAEQVADYLLQTRRALGVMPTADTLVVERFFDEVGGMHVVLHAPLGARINRALGLLLRKRFCRGFNVELQAAAGEDAILLSLGPMHSFPLDDLRHYLSPKRARDTLVQALLDSPLFQTRFRWNASRSLAILRRRGQRKVPPRFQRMDADDLLAECFPDQVACLENIQGDRRIPDHPLVAQTIDDCLTEAMDVGGFERLLDDIEQGRVRFLTRDVSEPSLLAHEILTARPYAFLDDAPLEERRAQAVSLQKRSLARAEAALSHLDESAIREVRAQAEPDPRDPDELHDALSVYAFLTADEIARFERAAEVPLLAPLLDTSRARLVSLTRGTVVVAARFVETLERATREGDLDALVELVRGRLEWASPVRASELTTLLSVDLALAQAALYRLESEGFALRGHFLATGEEEFAERRLLARMHRATLDRRRREIDPVTPAQYVQFLTRFQAVHPEHRRRGELGTLAVIEQLAGFRAAAGDWEERILAARVEGYRPEYLDALTNSGQVLWMSVARGGARLTKATPLVLLPRERLDEFESLFHSEPESTPTLGAHARKLDARLQQRGASFYAELTLGQGLLPSQAEAAVLELLAAGRATTDGYSSVRNLVAKARGKGRRAWLAAPARGGTGMSREERVLRGAGRISPLPRLRDGERTAEERELSLQQVAWQLLRRYGVVARRILEREAHLPPWREILRAFHRLEARGEIHGGRFVTLFSGEQFALPEAVELLRASRRANPPEAALLLAATDPLNLAGLVTPDPKVARQVGQMLEIRGGHFETVSSTAIRAAAQPGMLRSS